jgi:SPP1 family predicted phage head-tail adaptor
MASNPGKKNRKITILQRTVTNSLGDAVSGWSTLASVWAEERPLRMDERFQSDSLHSVRVSNFRIWYRDDVGPEMQLSYAGLNWKITGLAELGFKEELDITAEVVY